MADSLARRRFTVWAEPDADTRWLSYDELVEITGIKRASVARMVRRKKWPKRSGNQPGSVRVEVPADAIAHMQARKIVHPPPSPPPAPAAAPPQPDLLPLFRDMAWAIAKLETTLAEVRAGRAQVQAELDHVRAAALRALDMSAAERTEANHERRRTTDQRRRLTDQVNALSAELARLHAMPRTVIVQPPAPPQRIPAASLVARWLRSG